MQLTLLQNGQLPMQSRATTDLEEAYQVAQEVLELASKDRPTHLSRFAGLYCEYLRSASTDDLEEAIQVARGSVQAPSSDHLSRATSLTQLAICLADRYRALGALSDINDAILTSREALKTIGQDQPYWATISSTFAVLLFNRYKAVGALIDLEESVSHARKAIDQCLGTYPPHLVPRNSSVCRLDCYWASRLQYLAAAYHDRFRINCLPSDSDMAVELYHEALDMYCHRHVQLACEIRSLLGLGYMDRYRRTQATGDLESSLKMARSVVVSITPQNRPQWFENLGVVYQERWLSRGAVEDLDAAVQCYRDAINATPQHHPDRLFRLSLLGGGQRDRYRRTKIKLDFEDAFELGREIVAATLLLGNLYEDKYHVTSKTSDLDMAIQLYQEALQATPKDDAIRATRICTLGCGYVNRFKGARATSDLKVAIQLLQDLRSAAGRNLVPLYVKDNDWDRAYGAARTVMYLVPLLVARWLPHADKKHILSQFVGFSSDAAAIAIIAGKSPFNAIDLLELGHGTIAGSLEELYTDITSLMESHPELGREYANLRDVVVGSAMPGQRPRRQPKRPERFKLSTTEDKADRGYAEGNELEKLIDRIRDQPGFEHFLLPPTEQGVKDAARPGAIVMINVSGYRCDALVVEVHQIRLVELPYLKKDEVEKRILERDIGSLNTLAWLWSTIAGPILNALGFTEHPLNDTWPHVWWIPTGPLGSFPLHAAGQYINFSGIASTEAVLDRVMSSYASSIKALIYSRPRRAPRIADSSRALLVGMEETPGQSRLPFAEREIALAHDVLMSMSIAPIKPAPIQEAILSELLESSEIFHFAGHARSDRYDALKSYLCLGEKCLGDEKPDLLKAQDLLKINLRERAPFLAYLSACGTGRNNEKKSIDESIHLITAFQMAGFRQMIGTLWEVNDEACAEMARITYEGIRDGGMTDESSLAAFGLAASIAQFVAIAGKVVKTTRDLAKTNKSLQEANEELDVIAHDLRLALPAIRVPIALLYQHHTKTQPG
ncbi:hypothetical protein HD806DRAFT_527777 [Xylariaceae sp. AK1471]|nr:hypothetical protein HD806DRAFT_527777 [Xylariaceae sp. AK1471]